MDIHELKEHDDGSVTLQVTFSPTEMSSLLERAFVDMLRDYTKPTLFYVHNET